MIPQRGSLLLVLLASHKLLNVDTSGLEHALDILFGVGRADLKHDRKLKIDFVQNKGGHQNHVQS